MYLIKFFQAVADSFMHLKNIRAFEYFKGWRFFSKSTLDGVNP